MGQPLQLMLKYSSRGIVGGNWRMPKMDILKSRLEISKSLGLYLNYTAFSNGLITTIANPVVAQSSWCVVIACVGVRVIYCLSWAYE